MSFATGIEWRDQSVRGITDDVSKLIGWFNSSYQPTIGKYNVKEAFAEFHRMKYAVMVNSGSSANLIGIAALCYKKNKPLQRGEEVIVPAISWATTYHPLQQYGLKIRVVDVELDSINMDVTQLEAALTLAAQDKAESLRVAATNIRAKSGKGNAAAQIHRHAGRRQVRQEAEDRPQRGI